MRSTSVLSRAVSAVLPAALPILAAVSMSTAHAESPLPTPDMGKLLATGGVSELEGAGGGGLTPWALITGYGTKDSYGANVHVTQVSTQDYRLITPGVAFGFADRFEVSFANQEFRGTAAALNGVKIKQDIVGVKVRVAGDAVYDQDSWMPQIAVGAQFKHNNGITGLEGLGVHTPKDLGAKDNSGTDYYVSATKLILGSSILLNGTLRMTKANQLGLLGFGGDRKDEYQTKAEISAAWLITRKLALGAEYRDKPHNLGIDNEKAYSDIFVAWFPTRNVSVTVAYAELGSIVEPFNPTKQKGTYLSLQAGF